MKYIAGRKEWLATLEEMLETVEGQIALAFIVLMLLIAAGSLVFLALAVFGA